MAIEYRNYPVYFLCGHSRFVRLPLGPGTRMVLAREQAAAGRVLCATCQKPGPEREIPEDDKWSDGLF